MAEAATLTGNLEVQIGPQGLEASLVFTPREEGPQWDRQKAYTLIEEAGIREGIDAKALQQLFDPQQSGGEQRSVVIARGSEPQEGRPPQLSVEKLSIPEQIQTYEQEVVPADRPPQVFLRKVEKTRRERTVTKKAKLPFLPDKQVTEVVWDRNEQLLPLAQPGQEQGRGYAHTSDVLAAYDPGQRARSGRDVLGRELAAEQSGEGEGPFLSGGLKLTGTEVRAEEAGFYRYGSNWIELIPFTLHEHRVYASENKLSCLLDFHPGSELARPPTAEQILEEAQAQDFPGSSCWTPGRWQSCSVRR